MPLSIDVPVNAAVDNDKTVTIGQQLPFEAPTIAATPGKSPLFGIDQTLARIALTGDPKAILSEHVTSQLALQTEQWLNRFGQARVNLSLDKRHFFLRQAEIMGLFPLKQQEHQLLFTQLGLHHQRSVSTTLNLGIGQRYIVNHDWLLGYNLFYDFRLQQRHQRLGLGVEARHDYLSLAINGYAPFSDWKVVDKTSDQLARPARAVDLIVDAYLPDYPQLGGRVSAERYFDQQVGAFDANRPNSKPAQALSLGIHYTPVPLLQVGYHYTMGRCPVDKGRQQLQLTAHYHLGVPLRQQLESSRVAQLRTLRGSLLEPVQRNHQVVLAYKTAQPVVALQLPQDEIGNIGEKLSLPLNLSGDHKLRFHGSLGQAAQFSNGNVVVTLPNHVGLYDLQVEVLDQQDQRVGLSNRMTIQVFDVPKEILLFAREILTPGLWSELEEQTLTDIIFEVLVFTPIWPERVALECWELSCLGAKLGEHFAYKSFSYYKDGTCYGTDLKFLEPIKLCGDPDERWGEPGERWCVLDGNNRPFYPSPAPGSTSTGIDYLYDAVLSGLEKHGIRSTVPELRKMVAQALLENFKKLKKFR